MYGTILAESSALTVPDARTFALSTGILIVREGMISRISVGETCTFVALLSLFTKSIIVEISTGSFVFSTMKS